MQVSAIFKIKKYPGRGKKKSKLIYYNDFTDLLSLREGSTIYLGDLPDAPRRGEYAAVQIKSVLPLVRREPEKEVDWIEYAVEGRFKGWFNFLEWKEVFDQPEEAEKPE